jgi:hypothetical protein
MIVTIHQPHYMPWLGYLHRMARADLFVLLDHVQFERGNYQNRSMVRIGGAPRWLTVPVVQRSQKERIADKRVDNSLEGPRWWARTHFLTLRHAYREAGYLGTYAAELRSIYETRFERLAELNAALLGFLRDAFNIRTPLVRSSELAPQGAKSELVLDICRRVGADTLLVGLGASREYLDREALARAGVKLALQEFNHPVYPQCGARPFSRGLSAIDLLLNCGPRSAQLLSEDFQEEWRAAA